MTTTAIDQLTEVIQELKTAADSALSVNEVKAITEFERHLSKVDTLVRETQQHLWADEARTTIKNLKQKDPISETDKETIRTFLISDAERYLALENNFQDWTGELNRLMDELIKCSNVVDRDSVADMRGYLKDAKRVVPDIRNFLDEKVRVEKLEEALKTLDPASKKMLANLMEEQLRSSKR